jgi:hypothetical protein
MRVPFRSWPVRRPDRAELIGQHQPPPAASNPSITTGQLTADSPWILSTWFPHGHTQWWSYQPVSRFWPLQFIEGGWLLALSVILIAATVWLVRRRAA